MTEPRSEKFRDSAILVAAGRRRRNYFYLALLASIFLLSTFFLFTAYTDYCFDARVVVAAHEGEAGGKYVLVVKTRNLLSGEKPEDAPEFHIRISDDGRKWMPLYNSLYGDYGAVIAEDDRLIIFFKSTYSVYPLAVSGGADRIRSFAHGAGFAPMAACPADDGGYYIFGCTEEGISAAFFDGDKAVPVEKKLAREKKCINPGAASFDGRVYVFWTEFNDEKDFRAMWATFDGNGFAEPAASDKLVYNQAPVVYGGKLNNIYVKSGKVFLKNNHVFVRTLENGGTWSDETIVTSRKLAPQDRTSTVSAVVTYMGGAEELFLVINRTQSLAVTRLANGQWEKIVVMEGYSAASGTRTWLMLITAIFLSLMLVAGGLFLMKTDRAALMAARTPPLAPVADKSGSAELASLAARAAAFVLDLVFLLPVLWLAVLDINADSVFLAAWFAGIYFIMLEYLFGQTVGKRVFRIRVTGEHGGTPSFLDSIIRNLLKPLDLLFLVGLILIGMTGKRRRLGDMAAKTSVTRDSRPDRRREKP